MSGTNGCAEDARRLWPRLGSFPLTNGIGALVLSAWGCTALISFADALVPRDLALPAAWWEGLKWFSGYAFAQFAAKRWTNGRGVTGNGNTGGANPA